MTLAPLALAAALAALPGGSARYEVSISGVPVGVAELTVRCAGEACRYEWTSRLVLPEAAGGRVRTRRIRAAVDPEGRLRGAPDVEEDGASTRRVTPPADAVAASLAEVALLARLREGADPAARACFEVVDEASGAVGPACARRTADGAVAAEVLRLALRLVPDPDGFPGLVEIPSQAARYRRDPAAALPARPPRLEVRVAGPADPAAARRFCGRPLDPPPPAAPAPALPAPEAAGESCRAQALDWARRARAAGFPARIVVGVAHDGRGFAWHAWAEARVGDRWVPVDPAFGALPARGPRFTLARFAPGDRAAEDEAGRAILACWGRAAVE